MATQDNAAVNKVAQIGLETTPGTLVTCTKILEAISIEPGIKSTNKPHRAQGRKHPTVVTQGKEMMEFKLAGEADFEELVYPFSSIFGSATITAATGGTLSKQWLFAPVVTGNQNPNTFTIEKGDAVRAYKFGYGLVTGVTVKYTRDSIDFSGNGLGQAITDGITLTPSLSPVTLQPVLGNMVNYYVDTTSANLGTTQILDVMEAEFSFTGAYGPYWPMVRANASFARHIDLAPKAEIKLLVQADSSGMSYLSNLRSGATQFLRIGCLGGIADGTAAYTFNVDAACKVINVAPFSDKDGVYAVEWTFQIVEDPTWTHALQVTLINMLAAL